MARKLQRSTEFDDMYIDNDEGKYVKQSRVSSFTNKEGEMLFRASTPEEKFKYETEKRLNIKKKVDQKIGDKFKANIPYELSNIDYNKARLLKRKEKLAKEKIEKERKDKFDALKKERDKVKALEARPKAPLAPAKSATNAPAPAPLAPAPAPLAQNIIVAQDLTVAQATAALEVAKKNEDIAAKEAEKKIKEAEDKKKEEEKTALAAKEAQKKAEQEKVVAEKKIAEEVAKKKVADEKNALAANTAAANAAALAKQKDEKAKAEVDAAKKALVIAQQKEAAAAKQKEAEEEAKKAAADKRGPAPYTTRYVKGQRVLYNEGTNDDFDDFDATILEVIPNERQIESPSYRITYEKYERPVEKTVSQFELQKSPVIDNIRFKLNIMYKTPNFIKTMMTDLLKDIANYDKNVIIIENNIFILVEKLGDNQYKYYFFKKDDLVINNPTISHVTDINELDNKVGYVNKNKKFVTVSVSKFIELLTPENKKDYEFTESNIEKQKSGKKGGRKFRTRKYKRKRSSNIYKRKRSSNIYKRISRATRKYKRSSCKATRKYKRKRSSK